MTLITDILARVARQVSVGAPSSWLSATDDEYVEIRDDFLVETAETILDRLDLPSPVGGETTITGTGVETYSLPANFLRVQRGPLAVYEPGQNRGLVPVTDDGAWEHLQEVGATGVYRYYQITGYDGAWSISFYPFPSVPITVHYVTKNWLVLSGVAKSSFTDALDEALLPRKLLEAGIVWRWRERKGLPFADKYAEFETLLARLANDSRGRRVISMGDRTYARWQDLVPAQIPSS